MRQLFGKCANRNWLWLWLQPVCDWTGSQSIRLGIHHSLHKVGAHPTIRNSGEASQPCRMSSVPSTQDFWAGQGIRGCIRTHRPLPRSWQGFHRSLPVASAPSPIIRRPTVRVPRACEAAAPSIGIRLGIWLEITWGDPSRPICRPSENHDFDDF